MSKKLKKQVYLYGSAADIKFSALKAAENMEETEDKEEQVEEKEELPTFEMVAYTGGLMDVGFGYPVGIQLSDLNLGNKKKPILCDHNPSHIVGHSVDARVINKELRLHGIISADNEYSENVVKSSRNGFPWQSSVGVRINKMRLVEENETASLNGTDQAGPFYLVTAGVLNEVSFVALGADSNTSSIVANQDQEEEVELEAKENNPSQVSAGAQEGSEVNTEVVEVVVEKIVEAKLTSEESLQGDKKMDEAIKAMRDEQIRISAVINATKDYPEVQAKAIADGLSVAEAKAAVLDVMQARQGSEVKASYVNVGAGAVQEKDAIECAMCMQAGVKGTEKAYTEKTLDAAHKLAKLPLKRMMEICAQSEGISIDASMSTPDFVRAAYSTVSLPVILGNVANKSLLAGFDMGQSAAAMIAEKLTSRNFQIHTGVKLGGTGLMDRVDGGEVKHGTFGEESFTFKTNTVAKIIGLSRQDIINDDLGAFTRLARNLGMSAFKTRENDFWALVLANTGSFFGSGNNNEITTALSITALAEAEAKLAAQVGIDGTPASITADFLVVPSQLAATARAIYKGTMVISGSSTLQSNANAFEGVYQPIVTPYLSNSTVHANASETAWYLMSKMQAPFGISYLNGSETPVVEEVPLTAEFLGRCWRGVYDFGVCAIEHRGGVMSTGVGS